MAEIERFQSASRPVVRHSAGGGVIVEGFTASYGPLSEDRGGYVVRIRDGAFDRALRKSDPVALVNHDPNLLMGRFSAGTLRLCSIPGQGLHFKCSWPDTAVGHHMLEAIRRGDLGGCSFSCTFGEDTWHEEGDLVVRTIVHVDELFDVGPVTYPAFRTGTSLTIVMPAAAPSMAASRPSTPAPDPAAALRARRLADRARLEAEAMREAREARAARNRERLEEMWARHR